MHPILSTIRRHGSGLRPLLPFAVFLVASGCDEPRGGAFAPSRAVVEAPPPTLGETATLRAAFAGAADDAARLDTAAAALAARRDAARARAAALEGPVVDPALRARLLAAATADERDARE